MKLSMFKTKIIFFLLLFIWTGLNHQPSYANILKKNPASAKLVIKSDGKVLYTKNANSKMYPASLTKLMTLYLTFEAIKHHRISSKTPLIISKRAASMPRSKLWLAAGKKITIEEAVLSLIIRSANDSAVVLAENLAGSEQKFANKMNARAKQLGMINTHFVNASGWHNRRQVTTAYDMAKLAIALKRDFPEYYHLFSRDSFYYNNTLFKGYSYVLSKLYGAEGLKTGYTAQAGWNIVTAANRGNTHLIGVILGSKSHRARDLEMIKLIESHFNKGPRYKNKKPIYASATKVRLNNPA
jgi:serine-type D-Ala-D-Ala carboxypeptidase (penicillin-binding protein 5/6)